MNGHVRTNRWAVFFGAALLATLVGIVAYNAGVSHGLVQSGQWTGDPGAFRLYGWYRPWGVGFFFPFLFFGLWFFALRGLFWGGPWRRYRYYGDRYEMPPAFEDWHKRAHERMKTTATDEEDRSRR